MVPDGAAFDALSLPTMEPWARVLGLSGGGFVVVALDKGSGNAVFVHRFDSAGDSIHEYQAASLGPGKTLFLNGLTSAPSGGFWMYWKSQNEDMTDQHVWARLYDKDDVQVGVDMMVTPVDQNVVSVIAPARLVSGEQLLLWQDNTGSGQRVYGRYGGIDWSNPSEAVQMWKPVNSVLEVSIGVTAGGFALGYRNHDFEPAIRFFGSALSPVPSEIKLSVVPASSGVQYNSQYVAANSLGRVAAVWGANKCQEGGPLEIAGAGACLLFRLFTDQGVALTSERVVNEYQSGDQYAVGLVALSDNSFLAVWYGPDPQGGGLALFGRRFDSDGNPL